MDYLFKDKSGVWLYRRRFPKDLKTFIQKVGQTTGGRELFKRSLLTRTMKAPGALERYTAARLEYEEIVAKAEKVKKAHEKREARKFDELDDTAIAILADRYHAQELEADANRRKSPVAKEAARQVTGIMRAAGFELPSVSEAAEWTLSIREAHKTIQEAARSMRAIGDIEGIVDCWGEKALSLASEQDRELKPGGRSHIDLCVALHDAEVKASEDALRRLDGDLVPTPAMPEMPKSPNPQWQRTAGISIIDLYEAYAAVPGRSPKTVAQWRPYIVHLTKFLGHDDVNRITHEDLVAWRNHLRDNETYRGRPLSAKTINGSYMGALNALLAWAKGDALIATNPMLEVSKVKLPSKPRTRSKAFTADEALSILKATVASNDSREGEHLRNAKRWCPWLMAYSGARVNEITQLRKADIITSEGVTFMRITPEAGRVKSKVYRLVPLHSHLIAQGFLDFVKSRQEGPLFFDPDRRRSENAINRQSNRLGSKLAAWVHTLGIEGVMPNHAWRHYFISEAPRHQLDPRATRAITGHSASDAHGIYTDVHVEVLAREIEKIPRYMEITPWSR